MIPIAVTVAPGLSDVAAVTRPVRIFVMENTESTSSPVYVTLSMADNKADLSR